MSAVTYVPMAEAAVGREYKFEKTGNTIYVNPAMVVSVEQWSANCVLLSLVHGKTMHVYGNVENVIEALTK